MPSSRARRAIWSNGDDCIPDGSGLLGFKPYSEFPQQVMKPQIVYSQKLSEEIEAEMAAVVAAYEGR